MGRNVPDSDATGTSSWSLMGGDSSTRQTVSETVLNITIDHNKLRKTGGGSQENNSTGSSRTDVSKLLSPIYALLVVLIGVIFPITEALYDSWLNSIYNMLYIVYTLSLSSIFVIYLQLHLMHDKRPRHDRDAATVHNDEQSPDSSYSSSNHAGNELNGWSRHRRQSVDFEAAVVRMTDTGGLLIEDADAAARRRSISNGNRDVNRSKKNKFRKSPSKGSDISSLSIAAVSFHPTGQQVKRSGSVRSNNGVTAMLRQHKSSARVNLISDVGYDVQSESEAVPEESDVWIDLTKLGTVFSHEGSNLYVRIGAIAFAIGNLIYTGLEVEARLNPSTQNCSGRFGWIYIIRLVFIVFQTFFVLKNSAINVRQNGSLIRFGLMHTIATNVSIWLGTLINEIMISFNHMTSVDGHMLSTDDNTTTPDEACESFHEKHFKTAQHLFPFVLEYSLIAMGILIMMYTSIGQEHDKRSNVLRGIQNLFKIRALEMSSTDKLYEDDSGATINTSYVKLNKSHRGIFAGAILLTGCLIAIIIYLFAPSSSQMIIYLATEISVNVLLLAATIVAIVYLHQLSYIARPFSIDDFLLVISTSGAMLYELSAIMASVDFVASHGSAEQHFESVIPNNNSWKGALSNLYENVETDAGTGNQLTEEQLRLTSATIASVQILSQVLLTLSGMRRYPCEVRHVVDMPGRGFITFLVIGNVTVWVLRTALAKALTSAYEIEYYGPITWLLLFNINLPFSLFFRFHSSVCFADIWHTAYTSPVDHHRRHVTDDAGGPHDGSTSGVMRNGELSTSGAGVGISNLMRSYSMSQLNAMPEKRQ